MHLFVYAVIFLYGIVVGSFLNVCILRIPGGETIVSKRSHCTSCGHQLAWYDLIPLFSFLFLRGKCRYCKSKISWQYPVIEAANGILWVVTFAVRGLCLDALLICGVISCLLVLSLIDFRYFEIPLTCNLIIGGLGIARLLLYIFIYKQNVLAERLIGFAAVAAFLLLVYFITKGEGIGGGDIKLMAASGLFLGWKGSLLSLILGCLFGSVIHILRMKISGEGKVLAMGPYLSAGILIAMLWGERIISMYIKFFN